MNPVFESGRWYMHKSTNKVYEFIEFDSDRPHPDVVMNEAVGMDPQLD